MPSKYQKWIKEEVVYIITTQEKEVFYKLETDKERDMLIELFWKHRDPTPGTPRNEFKDEHYRRVEHANKKFKRFSSVKGWRTDMGRIYIILGDPIQIDKFHRTETYPIQIWTYFGNPKFGQAPIFRLLFVRKFGVGPYELYSPLADGPKILSPLSSMRVPDKNKLARQGWSPQWLDMVVDPGDLATYQLFRENVSFELAEACFSSFPGRDGPGYMLPSSILISEVKTYPQKKVKDDYAYEFLEHKAFVEVDYSVNYINCLSRIQVLEDKPGLFFVNYSIEPETLSVDFYEDKFFTNVRMSIRVTDLKGKTILQHMRYFPVELKKKQLKKIGKRPFQICDSFPLIPGSYKLSLLFENMVTKEFTSLERDISVPEPGSLYMSSIILADRVDKNSPYAQLNKAFQIGNLQIYPSLRNHFFKENSLFIFFQINGMGQELEEQGSLEFAFFKGEQRFKTITKKIKEYESSRDFLQEVTLKSIPSGRYEVEVSFLDGQGKVILTDRKEFSVSAAALPTSWIVSQSKPPGHDPLYSFLLGNQFINKGEIDKARNELEKACNAKPDSLDYALSYAKTLMLLRKYQDVKEILEPFAKAEKENFALYYYLGKSFQEGGKLKEAISHYQRALSHKGNIIEIINSIGECYFKLGDNSQALRAWQKSLEINPDQEEIKKIVKVLEKEKL